MAIIKHKNFIQTICVSFLLAQFVQPINGETTSCTLAQNNGSLDDYCIPVTDITSEATAGTTTATTDTTKTTHTTETSASGESLYGDETSTQSTLTQNLEAATSDITESESTTVWWTPASELSLATATTETSLREEFTISYSSTDMPSASSISEWTPETTTGSLTSETTTASTGTCQAAWDQCGGADYSGETCCQSGLTCVTVNSNWARCITASTLSSSVTGDSASTTTTGTNTRTTNSSSSSSKSVTVVVYSSTSVSTSYSFSTSTYTTTVTSTNSAGSTYTSAVETYSVTAVAKAISSTVEVSTSTNGGHGQAHIMNNNNVLATVFLGLGLFFGI